MIQLDISDIPDRDWNNRLLESGIGSVKQAGELGDIYKEQGAKPLFIKFLDTNGTVTGQLVGRLTPYKSPKKISSVLNKLIHSNQFLFHWNYGPVIFNSYKKTQIFLKLNEFIKTKKCRVSGSTNPLDPIDVLPMNNVKSKKWTTILINLNRSKEELYSEIDKHSGRKNIERSIKRGVIIEEISTPEQLKEYNDLRNKMRQHLGSEEKNIDTITSKWKKYGPIGLRGFLAKKDDITVGGISFNSFCQHIIEIGVGRTEKDYREKLYSQDLLKWKIIEWGIKNKMNYFNLAGFNPNPVNKKEEGIKRYKEKWGGQKRNYWLIKR